MSSPRRRSAGARSLRLGKEWEREIAAGFTLLEASGLPVCWRQNPKQTAMRRNEHTGELELIITGKGPPDFTVRFDGAQYELEAKHTMAENDRWSLSALEDHQAIQLDRWMRNDCICGVLLNIRGRHFAIPWVTLGPLWWRWHQGDAPHGGASLHLRDVRTMGHTMDMVGTWLRWLSNPTPIRGSVPRLSEENPCQSRMF